MSTAITEACDVMAEASQLLAKQAATIQRLGEALLAIATLHPASKLQRAIYLAEAALRAEVGK